MIFKNYELPINGSKSGADFKQGDFTLWVSSPMGEGFHKIQAIKAFRNVFGTGLKETKEFFDRSQVNPVQVVSRSRKIDLEKAIEQLREEEIPDDCILEITRADEAPSSIEPCQTCKQLARENDLLHEELRARKEALRNEELKTHRLRESNDDLSCTIQNVTNEAEKLEEDLDCLRAKFEGYKEAAEYFFAIVSAKED